MTLHHYVLDANGEARAEPDLLTWARWYEDHSADRMLAKTEVGDARVSTLFLATDHAFMGGPPILWETMIFGGRFDERQWRYHTREEAQRGHEAIVDALRRGKEPPG